MIPYGRSLTVALVALLVALGVGGAGLAYATGSHLSRSSDTGTSIAGDSPASSGPGDGAAAGHDIATETASGSVDDEAEEGPVDVALSPSATNSPYARQVTDLISRYFTAINRHDYDAWLATVTTAQSNRDRDGWKHDYSTTTDSEVYISDITAGDPMTVRMQFVSHQALEFAPRALPATCVRWDVTYLVLDEGVGLRVGTSASDPEVAAC